MHPKTKEMFNATAERYGMPVASLADAMLCSLGLPTNDEAAWRCAEQYARQFKLAIHDTLKIV